MKRKKVIRESSSLSYPEVGKVFELTFDGSQQNCQPLAMVANYGNNSNGWQHRGPIVVNKQSRKFKLVYAGRCGQWKELIMKLKTNGLIPEGQWLEAYKEAFPSHRQLVVGVADTSWIDPDGAASFPCIGANGESSFRHCHFSFGTYFFWLMEVKESV